jgi:hypothetical protein
MQAKCPSCNKFLTDDEMVIGQELGHSLQSFQIHGQACRHVCLEIANMWCPNNGEFR